ncbi:MAG TPA: hypothetical protein VNU46_02160 [Gemmatimonadaceae bacterium]|jgi:hypothetical protein|nr:hypothetical protein [Gemmatimonadaceae bacterium]
MPLPDQPDLISLFVAPLNQLGVTYMVTGSLAAGTYGEPRLTNDVDLVIVLSAADAGRLYAAFDPSAFYVPPLEVIETERRRPLHGHFNLIHHDTAFKADVYLAGDDPLHYWALDRREQIMVDEEPVWVAPPAYVILRKLQYFRDAGSPKHLTDIRAMLAVLGPRLDQPALMAQIATMHLEAAWERVQHDR